MTEQRMSSGPAKPETREVLTHAILLAHIHYDPLTGIFMWRIPRRGRSPGREAGAVVDAGRSGYEYKRRAITIFGKRYYAHHLAWFYMTGEWPERRLDHRDCDALNNRWNNLRPASPTQNQQNSKRRSHNTTGFKGVSFNKPRQRFQAHIRINRKSIYLGLFDTAEEAHAAYVTAAEEHFGEFARAS